MQSTVKVRARQRLRHRGRRAGAALPIVLFITATMSIALAAFLYELNESAAVSRRMLDRRKVFYVTDGVGRAVTMLAQQYLAQATTPTMAGLETFVEDAANGGANLVNLIPSGYALQDFTVTNLGSTNNLPIPSGPFAGMMSQQRPFGFTLALRSTDQESAARVAQDLDLGKVSIFQFYVFDDGYLYLLSGSGGKFAGRIHANGNICAGGNNMLVEHLTSASGFYAVTSNNGCRDEQNEHGAGWAKNFWIADRPMTQGPADFPAGATFANNVNHTGPNGVVFKPYVAGGVEYDIDSGADAMPAAPYATWQALAQTRWGHQMQDVSFGTPTLKVPISGVPYVNVGRNAQHQGTSNVDNMRFLVDRVIANTPTNLGARTEPVDVSAQKFAYKADLRIVNGVWYLRDTGNPRNLGTPIWSDHPGTAQKAAEEAWAEGAGADVGQSQLFPAIAQRPKRYSYYVTGADSAASVVAEGDAMLAWDAPSCAGSIAVNGANHACNALPNTPVISYGSLYRVGANNWVPGYYEMDPNDASANYFAGVITGGASAGASCTGIPCWQLKQAKTRGQLLQGTRSGFRNPWAEAGTRASADVNKQTRRRRVAAQLGLAGGPPDFDGNTYPLANMLPINFDVAAFVGALGDGGSNELGDVFTAAGRTFNGIVWISSTWPGQSDNLTNDPAVTADNRMAKFWPMQGKQQQAVQPWVSTAGVANTQLAGNLPPHPAFPNNYRRNTPYQQALPYPLCTDSVVAALERNSADGTRSTIAWPASVTPANGEFQPVTCASYTGATALARPNALRVFNGANLNVGVLPEGLTIATNLPLFIMGDTNTSSVPANAPGSTTANWKPFLLAGDTINLMSTAWRDDFAPWNVSTLTYAHGSGTAADRLRYAGPTRYHAEFLAGWLESASGGRDELPYFARPIEDWGGVQRHHVGSIVIGFNSNYGSRFDWWGGSSGDDSTNKLYQFDYNLELMTNQPPGAPLIDVSAVRRWRR